MEQAKKRDHKIEITDVAIDKITSSDIPIYTDEQNKMIDRIHKKVLQLSKDNNDSNETAILFDLDSGEEEMMYGSENSVNIFDNPNALMMSKFKKVLFLAHNHPSTKNFSYTDIGVFLMNDSINGLSVVSNMGDVHIIVKTEKYTFSIAYQLLKSIRAQYDSVDEKTDTLIVKEFLKNAEKVGIIHR